MNNGKSARLLIKLGMVFLLVGVLLVVASVLAWVGVVPGKGIFYFLGALGSLVLHFVCVSLGGQTMGGLR
jgi:hypothetical protein